MDWNSDRVRVHPPEIHRTNSPLQMTSSNPNIAIVTAPREAPTDQELLRFIPVLFLNIWNYHGGTGADVAFVLHCLVRSELRTKIGSFPHSEKRRSIRMSAQFFSRSPGPMCLPEFARSLCFIGFRWESTEHFTWLWSHTSSNAKKVFFWPAQPDRMEKPRTESNSTETADNGGLMFMVFPCCCDLIVFDHVRASAGVDGFVGRRSTAIEMPHAGESAEPLLGFGTKRPESGMRALTGGAVRRNNRNM